MIGDRIPTPTSHRGVGIHDFQTPERIEVTVKPAIDYVCKLSNPAALVAYAGDCSHPPEARLLAAGKIEALWEMSAEGRTTRPVVDLVRLRAAVAGLDSLTWIDPDRYASLMDSDRGAVLRDPSHRKSLR